ncbi:VOC family protein [Nocardia sp. NBC_01377]|uniref:VOC family protein n=1 Tax=Nocardia sp. NBC_01377 TaxID=2903595 RepID=UPI003255873D
MIRAENQFHLGIVSDDFEATVAELSEAFGYRWGPQVGGSVEVTTPAGATVIDLACTYSVTVPRIEIVRSIPGTLWEPSGGGIHHLGYWSDDLAADAATLLDNGYASEVTRDLPNGLPQFAFLRGPSGIRIELVNRLTEPGLSDCWATERSAS